MKKFINKIPGGVKFMLSIFLIYFLTFFGYPEFIKNSFVNFIESFIGLLPMLTFVFTLVFFINIFLKPNTLKKHLGHDSGIKGFFYSLIGSVLLIGPIYIILPMLQDFKNSGMKNSLIAVFLNNRSVQPIFLPVMAYYFGLKYTIIISIFIVFFAIINGIIIGKIIDSTGE